MRYPKRCSSSGCWRRPSCTGTTTITRVAGKYHIVSGSAAAWDSASSVLFAPGSSYLHVLTADQNFTMELRDSESAAICSTDDGYAYVLMPLARER